MHNKDNKGIDMIHIPHKYPKHLRLLKNINLDLNFPVPYIHTLPLV